MADGAQDAAVTVDPATLAYVEIMLGVTWQDDGTDRQYTGWIGNGMAYLNDKLGEPGDYSSPGVCRELLVEYVRYARDAALDVFENNYLSRILAMQTGRKVTQYVAGTQTP